LVFFVFWAFFSCSTSFPEHTTPLRPVSTQPFPDLPAFFQIFFWFSRIRLVAFCPFALIDDLIISLSPGKYCSFPPLDSSCEASEGEVAKHNAGSGSRLLFCSTLTDSFFFLTNMPALEPQIAPFLVLRTGTPPLGSLDIVVICTQSILSPECPPNFSQVSILHQIVLPVPSSSPPASRKYFLSERVCGKSLDRLGCCIGFLSSCRTFRDRFACSWTAC